MKNKRRIHKALSMLLCCVMLLGLLPVTALAADVSSVAVQIKEPVAGKSLDSAPTGDTAQYTVGSGGGNVRWWDETAGREATGGTAVGGHTYRVEISVYAKNGYDFKNTVATVNDEQASVSGGTGRIYLETYFTVPYVIETLNVHGIDDPVPGRHPDYTGVASKDANLKRETFKIYDATEGRGNFTNGISWVDLTNPSSPKLLTPDSVFEVGHIYQVNVALTAITGNSFAVSDNGSPKVEVSFFGRTAIASKWGEAGKSLQFSYRYPPAEKEDIPFVKINELDAPKAEKTPDYSVELYGWSYELKATSASNPFVVDGVNWYDETAGYDMTANSKFVAGHTYTATVYLVPVAGFKFGNSIPGEINGNAAVVTGNGAEIQVKYTFPALAVNQITNVDIEAVGVPKTGGFPSYVAITKGEGYELKDRNDFYYRNGICWSVMEGTDLPVSGGTVFEGGQKYQVMMYLVAKDGYEFSVNDRGALNVRATIDGKSVAEVTGNKKEIVVTHYFPEPTENEKITNAHVTGIDAPAVGAYPDYAADVMSSWCELWKSSGVREHNGITWINNETKTAMVVGADKFEAGVSYSVVVGLSAIDGKEFVTDSNGTPKIQATINDYEAEVSGQNEFVVYLTYTFEELPAAQVQTKQLDKVAVTDLDVPAVGKAPDKSVSVSSEGYTAQSVSWKNKTTGLSVEQFEAGQTYQVEIVLAPAQGWKFADNVTGTLNGAQAGVSAKDGKLILTGFYELVSAKEIASVALTGFDTTLDDPAKGDPNKIKVSDQNVGLKSLTWTTKAVENGKEHTAQIVLSALNGYKFSKNVKAAVNTAAAQIVSVQDQTMTVKWSYTTKKAAVTAVFTDVSSDAYYNIPVQWAVENGITSGTSATTFSPDMTCSQAHILTFLWHAMKDPLANTGNPYSNAAVKEDQYYYNPFLWAWKEGVVIDKHLDPNAPCSRSDVVTYLWKLEGSPKTGSANFTDVPASAPYAQAVAWAFTRGITSGTSETTFSPDMTCTRGQIVTFLWNYMVKTNPEK